MSIREAKLTNEAPHLMFQTYLLNIILRLNFFDLYFT